MITSKKKIALQLYTVREDMDKDFYGTLKKVADMGYEGVEFGGFYGLSAEEMMETLKKNNLSIAACHISFNELENDIDILIPIYKKIRCTDLVVSYSDDEHRPGGIKFEETLLLYQNTGKKLKENGINLSYHNHDFEFVDYKGTTGFDYMYENVSSEYLNPEIDLCWVNVAGKNPIEYLEKYKNRCKLLHFKDFIKTEKGVEFKPLGQGIQDMKGIVKAAEKTVAKWYIVEQDFSNIQTPMQAAEMSIKYLKTLTD